MSKIPLIIDCDPGVDDAVALFLAFASPELDIVGITTVAGNVSARQTARNARIIRQVGRREDIPVHAGCERPMVRDLIQAGHFHGESGLGPLEIFEPARAAEPGHAVQYLIDTVMSRPAKEISLAVTGPMTNVAMAMILEPGFAGRLKQVVAMGGARLEGGNITASAEYNIYADPHAAHVVATSSAPLVMLGLDATHQVRTSHERITRVRTSGTPAANAAADLLSFCQETHWRHGGEVDSPVHDPCTIAFLIDPSLFKQRRCKLSVEIASELTIGHTSVEFRDAEESTVNWVTQANGAGVFDLLAERIAKL